MLCACLHESISKNHLNMLYFYNIILNFLFFWGKWMRVGWSTKWINMFPSAWSPNSCQHQREYELSVSWHYSYKLSQKPYLIFAFLRKNTNAGLEANFLWHWLTSLIYVWSGEAFSCHSLFHSYSAYPATLVPDWAQLLSINFF